MHRNSFFDAIENNLIYQVLAQLGDTRGVLTFIDVGAYDGLTRSQIHRHVIGRGWEGLVIEPAPAAFQALQATYAGFPKVRPVNCAIADGGSAGTIPFYCVRASAEPSSWEDMLSSLDRETILKQSNLIPDIAERIVEVRVAVRTLASLCQEFKLRQVDLIKIDAEGRDDEVLTTFDFVRYRPSALLFEHKLLPNPRLFALDQRLVALGYTRLSMWSNTLYLWGDFARDECIERVLDNGAALFPPGRDPEWGNGNWFLAAAAV